VLNDPSPKFTVSDVTTEKVKVLLVAWTAVESMTIFGSVLTELRNEFKTAGLEITVPAQEIDLRREE
jgi:small-conductance mechanosensitive channel